MMYFKQYKKWKQQWNSKEHSFINEIFEGSMITEIQCLNCKHLAY